MKTFSKQTNKWILSTALIAALGSQYYFSLSSKTFGSIEMSSTAPSIERRGKYIIVTSAEEKSKKDTEAREVQITCTEGCATEKRSGNVKEIEAILAKMISDDEAKKVEVKKEEPKIVETAAEKIRREREERQAEKERIKEENDQKLADAQAERNEKFKDEIDALTEKCEAKSDKLECLIAGFAKVLAKYKGKEKIDSKIVTDVFASKIGKKLVDNFSSFQAREENIVAIEASQGGQSQQTMQMRAELQIARQRNLNLVAILETKIPESYSDLKLKTLNIITTTSVKAAEAVTANYKVADKLTKERKFAEANQITIQARISEQALINNKVSLTNAANETQNTEIINYFSTSYMTDMNRVLANIHDISGTKLNPDSNAAPGNSVTQPNQTNTRNSRSGSTDQKIIGQPQGNNGVTWGTESQTPTGTRMGTNFQK